MYINGIITLFCIGLVTKIFSIFDVGSYSITIEIFAQLLMLFALFFGARKFSFHNPVVYITIILIIQGVFVSMLRNSVDASTITSAIQVFLSLLIFLFFASLDENNVNFFRNTIIVVGAVATLIGIYQFFARPLSLPFGYLEITNQQLGTADGFQRTMAYGGSGVFELLRVSSTFAEPGDLSKFMLICLSIGFLHGAKKIRFISQIFPVIGIVISQSIAGYILLALITPVFYGLRKLIILVVFISIFFIIAVSYNLGTEIFFERFTSIISGSAFENSERFMFIGEALSRIESVAFFGLGIGSSDLLFKDIVTANFWLNFAGEYGFFGCIIFIWLIAFMALKIFNLDQDWLKVWFFVEVFALLWKPTLLYSSTLFAVFGLCFAVEKINRKNRIFYKSSGRVEFKKQCR